ncbi:MAG: DUF3108 domain-containing protein [Gemmatimonadota bacterium]
MASALIKLAIAGSLSITISASAQTPTTAGPAAATSVAQADSTMSVPFGVGETAEYDVKFGALKVGTASTVVKDIEQVRGISAWHTVFSLKGGTFFYHVDDVFESWVDRSTFSSLRFYQTQQEGSSDRQKRYEIYPDRGTYMEMDKKPPREHAGVKDPLDDGSFLFFVRTLPLEVGHTYESNRYFRPERNPIRVRVLRKETIDVPAGRFDCVVLQPVIKTQGIFSENGKAEVWLSDDSRHVLVQLKSKLSFGSINLYLRSYKAGN